MVRLLTLILGPPSIVALAYLVARPDVSRTVASPVAWNSTDSPTSVPGPPAKPNDNQANEQSLVAECQQKRESLARRLGSQFSSVVHAPFVLMGDVSAERLDRYYRETIAPVERALAIAYFDRVPDRPISIVLVSGDEAYQSSVEKLDGQRRAAFAGYYERRDHRMVINIETGAGTIAHELTHALGHFDFPDMPEWFDEGLASLHEEARFSRDRLRITGLSNWRKRYLLAALEKETLRPLESLIGEARLRPNQQAIDYAQARYFCLFLQERGLLEPFYRKFRSTVAGDPTGLRTLRALFAVNNLAPIDQEFREWVRSLDRKSEQTGPDGKEKGNDEG